MAFNNTYDSSRDPHLNRRPSNIEMPDATAAPPTVTSETALGSPLKIATSSIGGDPALIRRVPDLLARIADQGADNKRLQQEKTVSKGMARDFHGRLTQATQSLTDLTVSYAKRVEEKNAVLNNNVAIEQRQTQMTKQAAKAARDISDMTTKIQEMEAQIRAYEIDNAELQDRVSILENESHTLQSQIHDLEYDKEQEQSPSSADDHTRSHRRDSVQRPRMDGNATSSRRDMDREREASYSGAVYVEHRRRSSEFYEGDTYRRGPRERNRDRSARDRPSIDDRFDAALYPATGRRIGRR